MEIKDVLAYAGIVLVIIMAILMILNLIGII